MRTQKEGMLHVDEVSPTAATRHNKLFPDSGTIPYRVTLQTAVGGYTQVDVHADTGDKAAAQALDQFLGAKVTNVTPAPRKEPVE